MDVFSSQTSQQAARLKAIRSRRTLEPEVTALLNQFYVICPYPDRFQMGNMARRCGLDVLRVKSWFQNRRTRDWKRGKLCRCCRYFKSPAASIEDHLRDPYGRPCVQYSFFGSYARPASPSQEQQSNAMNNACSTVPNQSLVHCVQQQQQNAMTIQNYQNYWSHMHMQAAGSNPNYQGAGYFGGGIQQQYVTNSNSYAPYSAFNVNWMNPHQQGNINTWMQNCATPQDQFQQQPEDLYDDDSLPETDVDVLKPQVMFDCSRNESVFHGNSSEDYHQAMRMQYNQTPMSNYYD